MGSFPFIKIYDVNFVYSGGLWQHEIGIQKAFWGIFEGKIGTKTFYKLYKKTEEMVEGGFPNS